MKALSMSASTQIRRGPVQSEVPNLSHSFQHLKNTSHANLQRALSQVSKLSQNTTNEILDNAHRSIHRTGAKFETKIFLRDKISLLQSTNDILTSELKIRDAVIETQRLKMNQMALQIQILSRSSSSGTEKK